MFSKRKISFANKKHLWWIPWPCAAWAVFFHFAAVVKIFLQGSNAQIHPFTFYACRCCCDRKSRAAYAQSFAVWQQATIEITCHDRSPRTLVVTFNRSQVNIGRASTPRSLFYWLFAPHICMVLFFTHIPFVVNHTINRGWNSVIHTITLRKWTY